MQYLHTAREQQDRCIAWWNHQLIANRARVAFHLLKETAGNLLPSMLLSCFRLYCSLLQFCLQLRPQPYCIVTEYVITE